MELITASESAFSLMLSVTLKSLSCAGSLLRLIKGELKDICVLVLKVQLDVNEYIAVGKSL